jgi:hypothetical protein
VSWLLGGPSYGGDEYVDQVAAGLRARAVEHCMQACGGVRVGVADYWHPTVTSDHGCHRHSYS